MARACLSCGWCLRLLGSCRAPPRQQMPSPAAWPPSCSCSQPTPATPLSPVAMGSNGKKASACSSFTTTIWSWEKQRSQTKQALPFLTKFLNMLKLVDYFFDGTTSQWTISLECRRGHPSLRSKIASQVWCTCNKIHYPIVMKILLNSSFSQGSQKEFRLKWHFGSTDSGNQGYCFIQIELKRKKNVHVSGCKITAVYFYRLAKAWQEYVSAIHLCQQS